MEGKAEPSKYSDLIRTVKVNDLACRKSFIFPAEQPVRYKILLLHTPQLRRFSRQFFIFRLKLIHAFLNFRDL